MGLLLSSLHLFFRLVLFVRTAFDQLRSTLLSVLHRDELTYIRSARSRFSKMPRHLGLVIPDTELTHERDLARLLCWGNEMGINMLTVFDQQGKHNNNDNHHQTMIISNRLRPKIA
jgi:hypothetical protein